MSKLEVDTIAPQSGTTLTVGEAGDTVDISNATLSANLNANNLTSGTIPDARFPATLPAVDGSNLTNVQIAGGYTACDAITVTNTDTFALTAGGSPVSPESANNCIVSLNGVIQAPGTSYTISGSNIVFASALSAGSDVIDFITVLGTALNVGTVSDGSITEAKIGSGAITPVKLGYDYNQYRNIIINGDMSIAQRGTSASSITTSGFRTCDRFEVMVESIGTYTISQDTDVPSGQGFSKSLKIDCTTADASPAGSDELGIRTKFEGQNLQYLKKGTSSAESLTLSFWVKCNKTGNIQVNLRDLDNSRMISYTATISASNTWEKKTVTFAGDTTGTLDNDNAASFQLEWFLDSGSDYSSGTFSSSWTSFAGANRNVNGTLALADNTANEFYITGVQLEAGTTASDFEFLPFDVNMDRCQRYYQKSYNYSDAPGTATSNGMTNPAGNTASGTSTGQCINTTALLKEMRAAPTIVNYDAAGTSGKVYGIRYGVNEYNGENGSSFRVGSKYFSMQRASGTSIITFSFHYTASAEL